jgi:enoyl-CoA hydratase/carnithine racemase
VPSSEEGNRHLTRHRNRVLILSGGENGSFCAGADLAEATTLLSFAVYAF